MIGPGVAVGTIAAGAGRGAQGPAPFKVAIWGQSEDQIILYPDYHSVPKEPLLAEGRVTYWWHNRTDEGAAGVQSVTLDAETVATSIVTPPMIRMANTFMQAMPGRDVHIVMQTMEGTSPTEIMDDGDTAGSQKRRWQDDWALHDAATADGVAVGYGWHSWFAAPGSWGSDYGENMGAFLLGRALDGSLLSYSEGAPLDVNGIQVSRTLRDLYGAGMPLWIAPGGAHVFIPATDLQSANVDAGGAFDFRLANKELCTESWRSAVTGAGLSPYFSDLQIQLNGYANGVESATEPGTWRDQAHPSGWTEEGYNLRVTQIAHAILRGAGVTAWSLPLFDSAEWEAAGAHVDVWSSAGPITTLRRALGEAPLDDSYPHWTDVLAFQVDGEPVNRAEIQPDGRIRIFPNSGSFTSATVLTFGDGGASGWLEHDDDAFASVWRDYPIVDLGLSGLAGVPVRPLPDADVLASTVEGAPTFDVATGGPYFFDPASTGTVDAATLRVKGSVDFAASGGAAQLASITAQVLEVQVLTGNGALRFYARDQDGTYVVSGATSSSGTIRNGVGFDLVTCLDHASGRLRAWVDGAQVFDTSLQGNTIQSNRNITLLGESASNALVGTFEVLEVWKTATADGTLPGGTPHVSITGPAGSANVHPWKRGDDAS